MTDRWELYQNHLLRNYALKAKAYAFNEVTSEFRLDLFQANEIRELLDAQIMQKQRS